MTAGTGAKYVGMIDPGHRRPVAGAMAVLTEVRGLDMGRVFAGCSTAVVTTGTTAGYVGVVEAGRGPGVGCVAIITGIAAGDVVRGLALCGRAIVTTGTAAKYVGMIDP